LALVFDHSSKSRAMALYAIVLTTVDKLVECQRFACYDKKTAYSGERKFRPRNSNNVSKLVMFMR